MKALVAGDKFDKARAQALVTEKTTAVQTKSPEVIAALADFYDSLNPAQQQKVRDFMEGGAGTLVPRAGKVGVPCTMPRILLIDDDAQLGPPLAAYFARFDLTLECALRPSTGLARLRQGGLDAAILDVMLPEMDGFELCRAIRRRATSPSSCSPRAAT
jgi:PleD family two-component response regulator